MTTACAFAGNATITNAHTSGGTQLRVIPGARCLNAVLIWSAAAIATSSVTVIIRAQTSTRLPPSIWPTFGRAA